MYKFNEREKTNINCLPPTEQHAFFQGYFAQRSLVVKISFSLLTLHIALSPIYKII